MADLIPVLLVAAGCNSSSSSRMPLDAGAQGVLSVGNPVSTTKEDDAIVDLLHAVESTVAVSSLVDNERDRLEHLVDGKQETAWNSRTGDLRGWIAFRLPPTARVTRVEMTAGFDKRTPGGDLFTMNHRIRRVRLSREGEVLREAILDLENRTLQGIDVEARGGDFRLDVLETVPGTNREWREIAVSEFRVLGHAGSVPHGQAHLPTLAIGSLDGLPPPMTHPGAEVSRGPFPTIAKLCEANDHVVLPLLRARFGEDAFPNDVGFGAGVHCRKGEQHGLTPAMFAASPFEDAALIDFDDLQQSHTSLALKTLKGWFRTDVHVLSHEHMDPGCLGAVRSRVEDVQIATTATGGRVAILRIVERKTKWAQQVASQNASVWTQRAYACRLDSMGAPSCEGPSVLATTRASNPLSFNGEDERSVSVDLETIPWGTRRKAVLGPAGELRAQ